MALVEDLWPKQLAAKPAQKSPAAILKEQAALLGRRVNNLIEGQVTTKPDRTGTKFEHIFKIVVPTLDFYQYPLFSVSHGVGEFYPLDVTAYGVPAQKQSEDEFVAWLRAVFASSETKRIIGMLLAMIEQPAGAGEPQLTLDQL
jgi:hypothetical protein